MAIDKGNDPPPGQLATTGSRMRAFGKRLSAVLRALIRKSTVAVILAILMVAGLRAYQSTQGPSLRPWHTIVPEELDAQAIVAGGWDHYVGAEANMFRKLEQRLRVRLQPEDRTPLNRYFPSSAASPRTFGRDWNHSFVLEPAGSAVGVVVLVHGLTDSPYSVRTLAESYRRHGFVAIAPRMPGHGTVPAGLTRQGGDDWLAAVEMSVTEARRRAGGLPVQLVGYSNGGALVLLQVMRRIGRGEAHGIDRIVLMSPMIEVSGFARYAGLAGLPSMFGRYAKSAWLDVLPEYNPFKYNSFPVRAARESYLVTRDLQAALQTVADQGRMDEVPTILAFQSVVDDTVNPRGVMTLLFDRLADNGSELVLFDVNRARIISPMLAPERTDWPRAVLQGPARNYTLTVIGAASPEDASIRERSRPARSTVVNERATGLSYPAELYSLSHVALPFPSDDPLYGNRRTDRRSVQLGTISARGERNTLLVSLDSLDRLSYNPFHSYMAARIAVAQPAVSVEAVPR